MKKYIIILLSMLLLAGSLTNAQTIKRSKQNTEQTQKSNNPTKSRTNTTKSSKAENPKSNNSSSTKKHQSQKANITPSDRSSSSSSSGSSSSRSTSRGGISVEPSTYDVTFSCNVPGADMYIDGKDYGHPKGTRSLKKGNYEVKLVADGYEEYTGTIQVSAGNTSFNFKMTRIKYEDVTFTCNVQNAQLFVDGQNLGNANGKYKLTASNHLIRVKSDGYQERIIYFDASSTSTLNIELSPN